MKSEKLTNGSSYVLGNNAYESVNEEYRTKAREEMNYINKHIYEYVEKNIKEREQKLFYRMFGFEKIRHTRWSKNEWMVKVYWGNESCFYNKSLFRAYLMVIKWIFRKQKNGQI